MFVEFGDPDQWVIVQGYGDGSAILAVFGPFDSEALAESAKTALTNGGIEHVLEVEPLRKVVTGRAAAVASSGRFVGANGLMAALFVAEGEAESPLEEVQLTADQEDLLALNAKPPRGNVATASVMGLPIVRVEAVEESTPYRYGWRP